MTGEDAGDPLGDRGFEHRDALGGDGRDCDHLVARSEHPPKRFATAREAATKRSTIEMDQVERKERRGRAGAAAETSGERGGVCTSRLVDETTEACEYLMTAEVPLPNAMP